MNDNGWQHDDSKWIWGFLYYNPGDKRLLPPKRIGWMGWTVNWANPKSVLFMIGLLVVIGLALSL